MLLEFSRIIRDEFGEDDGAEASTASIALNPAFISAVFNSSRHAGATIVRMSDGRGFIVRGEYTATMERLRNVAQQSSPLVAAE
jgi:hypothetical protein